MGKRIIQQARGHGSLTYRVRRKAYRFKVKYPDMEGKGKVLKLINSSGHSAPLAKIQIGKEIFYNPAASGLVEGQEIEFGDVSKKGNIAKLKDIKTGTQIYNIEARPRDGGKLIRSSGGFGAVTKKIKGEVGVLMPSKKEIFFNENCRATIGIIAGQGRLDKPIIKAGKMWHIMKSRNKLWPRTSAVKVNVVDHPSGSGRGKRIKAKISKLNAPPGRKVGLLRPRRTGKK